MRQDDTQNSNGNNAESSISKAFSGHTTHDPGAGTTLTVGPDGLSGRTALGHVSGAAEGFNNVAKIWIDQCPPFVDFVAEVTDQERFKYDIHVPDSGLRLDENLNVLPHDDLIDLDGKPLSTAELSPTGLDTLISMMPTLSNNWASVMIGINERPTMSRIINDQLDARNLAWENPDPLTQVKARRGQTRNESGEIVGKPKPRGHVLRIREDGGDHIVRAIVSETYTKELDNSLACNMILKAFEGQDTHALRVSHPFNDGDNIKGSVLVPNSWQTVEGDSDYATGVAFRNSEVKRFVLEVRPYLFRSQCVNGCVWGRREAKYFIKKKHLGNIDEKGLQELQEEFTAVIALALSHGQLLSGQMQNARMVDVRNVEKLILLLAKRNDITEAEVKAWYTAFKVEPYDTAFGLVNGLTRAAHESFSGHEQDNLESRGGDILTPDLNWSLDELSRYWNDLDERAGREVKDKDVERIFANL